MNTRMYKRRIHKFFYRRFQGTRLWRSKEEQEWLDVAPVGREFGSPDYERLQIMDLYEEGKMSREEAIRRLGAESHRPP